MKIGIISDTHVSKHINRIDDMMNDYFLDVDLIIHAGDYTSIEVIKRIRQYKKFIGVWGNNDNSDIRNELREKEVININNFKIGICHGHGEKKSTIDNAYDKFKEDKVDIIVFGHSHQPIIKTINKTLMLNPGSVCKKGRERWLSYIILEIDNKIINPKIVLFK